MLKQRLSELPVIGWREWVGLPDLEIPSIKVKVDTGARSSSLHAFALHEFERAGVTWVRFQVHPVQRTNQGAVDVEAEVLEFRSVRSSSGKAAPRPVIVTRMALLGSTWPIELTLARRDEMGFRMLLGREAFRGRFLIDAEKSYYGGRPKRKKKPKHQATQRLGRCPKGVNMKLAILSCGPKSYSTRRLRRPTVQELPDLPAAEKVLRVSGTTDPLLAEEG